MAIPALLLLNPRLIPETILAGSVAACAYVKYVQDPGRAFWFESLVRQWSRRATICILAAAAWPVLLRLSVLPWLPAPLPRIHDDFSHELVASTLLQGRLANPPHPLARFFETIYVLQSPSYSSIYPIGQGMVLAAGIIVAKSPWAGVLLSSALMCGAIAWMLRAWLPPPWAAVGAFAIGSHYALGWMDTYHGGSFCAFGGALIFGAAGRLRKTPSKFQALLLGAGWSVVLLVRPFESAVLAVLMGMLAAGWWYRTRPGSIRRWIAPLLSAALGMSAGAALTAMHNAATTGSALRLPYQLSQIEYGVPPSLLWQTRVAEPGGLLPEQKEMYWWQRQHYERSLWSRVGNLIAALPKPLFPVWFLPPLLWLLCRSTAEARVLAGFATIAIAATLIYPFFFSQYLAAYCCIFALLILYGLRDLSRFSWRGAPMGRAVAIFVLTGVCLDTLRFMPLREHAPTRVTERERVRQRLAQTPGQHLVIVRCRPLHSFRDEWVYNDAEIDASRIVWSRSRGPGEDSELLQYYPDRQAWIVDVGGATERASLTPYSPTYTARVQRAE